MVDLKVFVSSTCYDLSTVRSQLRTFIQSQGHTPLMSDYNDILYDPRIHTHTSCVEEVTNSDLVVLIVGSRFGGKGVPEALSMIDIENLESESNSTKSLQSKEKLSITQLEILKAVEKGVPIFTFIEEGVWHDHALYEKNKNKEFVADIDFPAIDKKVNAPYIFEFINFLRHRTKGNSVFMFSKTQDIEDILRKQWSALFRKLLKENQTKMIEKKRIDSLTEQFEDLKTAILTSIGSPNDREVARGVVRYRRVIDFIRNLRIENRDIILKEKNNWDNLLEKAGIIEVLDLSDDNYKFQESRKYSRPRNEIYLIKEDRTYFDLRIPYEAYYNISVEWNSFIELPEKTKQVIYDTLIEMGDRRFALVRYRNESIDEVLEKYHCQQQTKLCDRNLDDDIETE